MLVRILVASIITTGVLVLASACGGGDAEGDSPAIQYQSRPDVTLTVRSAAMEPTLHCAVPTTDCQAVVPDQIVVKPAADYRRGDLVAYYAIKAAQTNCGVPEGAVLVGRLVGIPGDKYELRLRGGDEGFVYIDGRLLDEPYLKDKRHDASQGMDGSYRLTSYMIMGDNRLQSCDSRTFGAVGKRYIVGVVTKIIRSK